jgi:hypothetical protein
MTARASSLPDVSADDVEFIVGLCTGDAGDIRTAVNHPVLTEALLTVCPERVSEAVGGSQPLDAVIL